MTARSGSARAARERARGRGAPRRAAPLPLTTTRPELLVGESDSDFRSLVHGLLGFLARHEQLRAGHASFIGLPGVEYTVLIAIAHLSINAGLDVNVKTVADHLHLSGAFITSVTGRLLDRGLIHKVQDTADRRRVRLEVSPGGRALLERLAPVQSQCNDVEFSCLSRQEFRLLLDIVERLIETSDRALALQKYLHAVARGEAEVPARRSP